MGAPGREIDLIGGVWAVDAQLGSGGMGSVYRCHNRHAPRIEAAIKLLDPRFVDLPEAKERFLREAEILSALDHPNVVKVGGVDLDSDHPYLQMELIRGHSLSRELDEGPLAPDRALALATRLCDALFYLHRRGVHHRDIKPDNILIREDGTPVLVDFGLAVDRNGRTITKEGRTYFGTAPYCPPEWIAANLDPEHWDCYALGALLYEMLTCRIGFPAPEGTAGRELVMAVMKAKQATPYLDPGPEIPQGMRTLVIDLTRREVEDRLRQAKAILDRIRELSETPDPADSVDDAGTPDAEAAAPASGGGLLSWLRRFSS